jgi:antitoxin CptB
MLNAEIMMDAEQRRLAWRCRRGMLELDIILQQFVREQFSSLNLAEMQVFDEMLELPDNDFWEKIRDTKPVADDSLQQVLIKLRAIRIPSSEGEA